MRTSTTSSSSEGLKKKQRCFLTLRSLLVCKSMRNYHRAKSESPLPDPSDWFQSIFILIYLCLSFSKKYGSSLAIAGPFRQHRFVLKMIAYLKCKKCMRIGCYFNIWSFNLNSTTLF